MLARREARRGGIQRLRVVHKFRVVVPVNANSVLTLLNQMSLMSPHVGT